MVTQMPKHNMEKVTEFCVAIRTLLVSRNGTEITELCYITFHSEVVPYVGVQTQYAYKYDLYPISFK